MNRFVRVRAESTRSTQLSSYLALALVVGLVGCAHRLPLPEAPDHPVLAGVGVELGKTSEPAPEGTTVHWRLGDGVEADGPTVRHAFPRAGSYTVSVVVHDAQGERQTSFNVTVERRSPWMAVPPEAQSALVFERFFNRLDRHRAFWGHLSSPQALDEAFERAQMALGVDLRNAEELRKAGIDGDEGIAYVSFAEEPQSSYLLIGTFDDEASEAVLKHALVASGASFSAGPNGWTAVDLGGKNYLYRHDRGYLILRVPGDVAEPPLALSRFEKAPDDGLLSRPDLLKLRAEISYDDVQLYLARAALVSTPASSTPTPTLTPTSASASASASGSTSPAIAVPAPESKGSATTQTQTRGARVINHVQSALWGAQLSNEGALGQLRVQLEGDGLTALNELFRGSGVPTLAQHAPEGAAAYFGFSGDVAGLLELWAGLPSAGSAGRTKLDSLFNEHGLDLEKLLGLLSGGVAVALYFDPAAFFRALVETGEALPEGEVLVQASVKDRAQASAALDKLFSEGKIPVERQPLAGAGGGEQLRFTLGTHPAAAAVLPDGLLLSYGLKAFSSAVAGPTSSNGSDRLETGLHKALPAEAFGSGRLLIHFDVARIFDQLSEDVTVPGLSPADLFRVRLIAQLAVASYAQIQDVSVWAAPAPDGLSATTRLRLRTTTAAATAVPPSALGPGTP